MSHQGKREMDEGSGPSSKRMRHFELPIRDATSNAMMEVDRKASDDGKAASDSKNTVDYSGLAVVKKMVSGEAEKAMDLSPAVVDLVKKLAATKLSPTNLAGAMLDSKNPVDVKLYTASAITRLEEQRKKDIEYTSAAVNDVAYRSYTGRRKAKYDMRRMNIIIDFLVARLPPSDKEDLSKLLKDFDDAYESDSDKELEFEKVLGRQDKWRG